MSRTAYTTKRNKRAAGYFQTHPRRPANVVPNNRYEIKQIIKCKMSTTAKQTSVFSFYRQSTAQPYLQLGQKNYDTWAAQVVQIGDHTGLLLIKDLFINFFSPIHKPKILKHQINMWKNKWIYFYRNAVLRVPSIRRAHCRPGNSLVRCGWVVPGVHSNHASESRVHINQLIIAGPAVSN
jgi:hypothetical protein